MSILDFRHTPGEPGATWNSRGVQIEKRYDGPISAVVLADAKGVLIIEPCSKGPSNAVILNEDGSERIRIRNPFSQQGAVCFTDAGYEGAELTLISRSRGLEMAFVIDEHGNGLRQYEIR